MTAAPERTTAEPTAALSATILGIFEHPEQVASAVEALRTAGFRKLTILSGTPYPEGAFGEDPERHRLFVFPFVGAACGLAVGLLLVIGTQLSFPLVTGGKPLLSIPPMVNVLYEGTLLGAIIFTVIGVLFESRLPDLSKVPHDPRITEGYLGVVVRTNAASARTVLQNAGAIDIIEAPP